MGPVIAGAVCLVVGVAAGFYYRKAVAAQNAQSAEAMAQKMILEAEREAEQIAQRARQEAKDEIAQLRRELEEEARARRETAARTERRIGQAEEPLERELEGA